jgi:hypothetical protein
MMLERWLVSVLLAALCSFYFWVLYVALNPNVSENYRWYFIEKKLRHWPGKRTLEYQLGDIVDLTARQPYLSRLGWGHPEKWGAWSLGKSSELYFRIPPSTPISILSIRGRPFLAPSKGVSRQVLKVYINGNHLASHEFLESRVVDVDIPIKAEVGPWLSVKFVYSDPRSLSQLGLGADTRRLGFAFERITIR